MKLFKNISLIPSIRPKCGADKKGFLNDVYTKGTREKKLQLDAPQSGRSMIEMLGVLAIIGVLSIGGIAGYSKAMFKYKFNKTMEIYSNAINKLIEIENSTAGDINIETPQELRDYGIVPDCDTSYNEYRCPLPLGDFECWFSRYDNLIQYTGIWIKFTQHTYESCIGFVSSKIYETFPNSWLYPDAYIAIYSKDRYEHLFQSKTGYKQLTTNDILNACQICKDVEACTIELITNDGI